MPGRSQRHMVEVFNRPSNGQQRPSTATAPTVSPAGPVVNGAVLTGTNGTFTSTVTVTTTRYWSRNGIDITGQTGATYTTTAADVGKQIRFGNIASNIYGTNKVVSLPVSVT